MTTDIVKCKLRAALEGVHGAVLNQIQQGEAPWTAAVKEAIFTVGRCLDYSVAASGIPGADPEWLYDIVWYKNVADNDKQYLSEVPLVAECEWGKLKDIRYDFEKMLMAQSRYKLLVFQAKSDQCVEGIINEMIRNIELFDQGRFHGEYLFAGWALKHWRFASYGRNLVVV